MQEQPVKRYKTIDVCRAADIERRQLDVLIARGLIDPEHTPEHGGSRLYTAHEAVQLAIIGEITRLGVPAVVCTDIVQKMTFRTVPFALVLYHGFVELIRSSERGAPYTPDKGRSGVFVRPEYTDGRLGWESLPLEQVADFITSPRVAAAIVVPIDRIEERVNRRLSKVAAQ